MSSETSAQSTSATTTPPATNTSTPAPIPPSADDHALILETLKQAAAEQARHAQTIAQQNEELRLQNRQMAQTAKKVGLKELEMALESLETKKKLVPIPKEKEEKVNSLLVEAKRCAEDLEVTLPVFEQAINSAVIEIRASANYLNEKHADLERINALEKQLEETQRRTAMLESQARMNNLTPDYIRILANTQQAHQQAQQAQTQTTQTTKSTTPMLPLDTNFLQSWLQPPAAKAEIKQEFKPAALPTTPAPTPASTSAATDVNNGGVIEVRASKENAPTAIALGLVKEGDLLVDQTLFRTLNRPPTYRECQLFLEHCDDAKKAIDRREVEVRASRSYVQPGTRVPLPSMTGKDVSGTVRQSRTLRNPNESNIEVEPFARMMVDVVCLKQSQAALLVANVEHLNRRREVARQPLIPHPTAGDIGLYSEAMFMGPKGPARPIAV